MAEDKFVLLEIRDFIAKLSINRPKALNALNGEVNEQLDACLDELERRDDVRCVVLYSEKNFAAGADIKVMLECNIEQARAYSASPIMQKLENLQIPVIAAMEGYALGGGLELALACDIRIASEDAKMGFPETSLGVVPGAGGTIRAPRLIGEAFAKELIYTGKVIDAQKASAIGLVNEVVPDGEVLEKAMKMAGKIAGNAPLAIVKAKESIKEGQEAESFEKGYAAEVEAFASLFATEDQKEGMRAFVEKRKPVYKKR